MTNNQAPQEKLDLYSDEIARLRFEPLSREQQHAELERVLALGHQQAAMPAAESAGDVPLTYASSQATECAGCRQYKHTPLRVDAMGGYVCLTCIDRQLCGMLGEFGYPPPPGHFDLVQHLHRQIEFSGHTFGPGDRTAGVCDHIRKELVEVQADAAAGVATLPEWVDVIILALDGAWRSGATPQQIVDAIEAKQTRNEGRRWPDWHTADPNKAIEHDRSGEVGP